MSQVSDLFTPQQSEIVVDGLQCDWYGGKQIIGYKLLTADEEVVKQWGGHVTDVLSQWSPDQPYLALHDLSAPGVAVFYMVYRNYEILNFAITADNTLAHAHLAKHKHPARVAVVLSMSLSGRTTYQVAIPKNADDSPINYRGFFKREQALQWLSEAIY
jgi:hypothetical protein